VVGTSSGVSSGLGITALPLIGFYCATKWAVEALHESLAQEVKPFGIKVTLVEPGAYATDFGKSAMIEDALVGFGILSNWFTFNNMADRVGFEFG
jgi:short-subunit dehydrogenase